MKFKFDDHHIEPSLDYFFSERMEFLLLGIGTELYSIENSDTKMYVVDFDPERLRLDYTL